MWLNDAWIYSWLYFKKANINAWNFNGMNHNYIYKNIKNQFYDWHCDSFNKTNENGKIRK